MDWQHWIERWDTQQEAYMANREERFSVIGEVVAQISDDGPPRVLDLGCGPGSLSVRLLDRIAGTTSVAVDADPVTQMLGQRAYGDRGGALTWIDADLADASWVEKVAHLGPFDAAVSTTALHWMTSDALARLYGTVFTLLRPGGAVVNGDHLKGCAGPRLDELERSLRRLPNDGREDWGQWWDALRAEAAGEPELAEAFAEQARRRAEHPDTRDRPGIEFHVAALHTAGFTEAGTVWQYGDDRVVVAVR